MLIKAVKKQLFLSLAYMIRSNINETLSHQWYIVIILQRNIISSDKRMHTNLSTERGRRLHGRKNQPQTWFRGSLGYSIHNILSDLLPCSSRWPTFQLVECWFRCRASNERIYSVLAIRKGGCVFFLSTPLLLSWAYTSRAWRSWYLIMDKLQWRPPGCWSFGHSQDGQRQATVRHSFKIQPLKG